MSKTQEFLIAMVALTVLLTMGCGTSGSGSGSGVVSTDNLTLSGVVTDGAVGRARVVLATMNQGEISGAVRTNEQGEYSIVVGRSRLSGLDNNDIPYIHASSDSLTTVDVGGVKKPQVEGQVEFRSLLAVDQLKTLASEKRTSITTDSSAVNGTALEDLTRNLTVSHVSNAKTLVFESRLRAKGILKEGKQISPKHFKSASNSLPEAEIIEALADIEAVDTALEDPDSDESKNMMLLAAATKEIVEQGNVDLMQGAESTVDRTNAAALLLELATKPKTLSTSFNNRLTTRLAEVDDDIKTRLKDSIKDTIRDAVKGFKEKDLRDAAGQDFRIVKEILAGTMFRFTDTEMNSANKSIALTFTLAGGSSPKRLTASQISASNTTRHLVLRDPANSSTSITFSFDTSRRLDLRILDVSGTSLDFSVGKLPIGTTTLSGGSVTLDKPTSSVANSSTLSSGGSGRFYPLRVSYGNGSSELNLVLGRVKTGEGRPIPLGIVAVQGLFDTSNWYYLNEANVKGRLFPVKTGTIDEVLNEVQRDSIDGLKAAHRIASSLRSSSNSATKREANIIFSVTNLAIHLNDSANPSSTLYQLLDKLGFSKSGRNLYNFISNVTKGNTGALTLGDIQGFSDLQNYFASTNDSLITAINESLAALAVVELSAASLADDGTIMNINFDTENVVMQKKDILALKSAFEALKFALYLISSHDFDLSDAAIKSELDKVNQSNTVKNFKEAVEFYSNSQNSTAALSSIQLIDLMKADSGFLGLRNSRDLANAKTALLNALENNLKFIQSIQGLNGGSSNSTFYVKPSGLTELKENKKQLLALWNNLKGQYHPTITIDGKSGADWYSIESGAGETLAFSFNSTSRNTTGFDLSYVYDYYPGHIQEWSQTSFNSQIRTYAQISFTKVNTGALFSKSIRDVINGGSVTHTTAQSDGHMLESHISGTSPSQTILDFAPGAQFLPNSSDKELIVQMTKAIRFAPQSISYSIDLTNIQWYGIHDPATFMSTPTTVDVTSDASKFKLFLSTHPGDRIEILPALSDFSPVTGSIEGIASGSLNLRIRFSDTGGDRFFDCWGSPGSSSTPVSFSACNEVWPDHASDLAITEFNQQ